MNKLYEVPADDATLIFQCFRTACDRYLDYINGDYKVFDKELS